ncbi:hypothetical protein [Variovorax sp. PBS-H4]|uniref:hypothetical protein n=1 Tax=Variovorax sp. PBS-H4 TaxID=434008 RepID=UPI0013A5695C|nr:hypothetical protein [Variovorax sp. PBS-H4]
MRHRVGSRRRINAAWRPASGMGLLMALLKPRVSCDSMSTVALACLTMPELAVSSALQRTRAFRLRAAPAQAAVTAVSVEDLEEVRRKDGQALRLAGHERKSEQLDAEEQHQHGATANRISAMRSLRGIDYLPRRTVFIRVGDILQKSFVLEGQRVHQRQDPLTELGERHAPAGAKEPGSQQLVL